MYHHLKHVPFGLKSWVCYFLPMWLLGSWWRFHSRMCKMGIVIVSTYSGGCDEDWVNVCKVVKHGKCLVDVSFCIEGHWLGDPEYRPKTFTSYSLHLSLAVLLLLFMYDFNSVRQQLGLHEDLTMRAENMWHSFHVVLNKTYHQVNLKYLMIYIYNCPRATQ